MTKLSEKAKVEMLEQLVLNASVEEIETFVEQNKPFEFTARALGLACLYRDVEIVKILVSAGATFKFTYTPAIKRNYGAGYSTNKFSFQAEYSPMIACTNVNPYIITLYANAKEWHFGTLPKAKIKPSSEEVRIETLEYLVKKAGCNFKKSSALYYAILWGSNKIARKLIEQGVSLSKADVTVLTETSSARIKFYRQELLDSLKTLSPKKCAEAIELFSLCLQKDNKKIVLTQKIFEQPKLPIYTKAEKIKIPFWDANVLRVLISQIDTTQLSHIKILKEIILSEDVEALSAASVWIKTPAQRDELINFASTKKKATTLAWLMDYKNRTADVAAEKEIADKKIMKELTEDPSSVSAMKKLWTTKKLEDGSLQITGYKGDQTDITIPGKIGTALVSSIGKSVFDNSRLNNKMNEKVISVTLSEGIQRIEEYAFSICVNLTNVILPESLTYIGKDAFCNCKNIEEIILPNNLKEIETCAFSGCKSLTKITIPDSVRKLGAYAFYGCENLKDVYLSKKIKKLGNGLTFSETIFDDASSGTIHAPAGSYAEQYAKEHNIPFVAE